MSEKKVIYLADDHRIVAAGIAGLLTQMPIIAEVKVFTDGQKLFQEISTKVPDLVFLDYEMPNWNGKKTLEEIKKLNSEIKCYILSMVNERSVIEDCIKSGASGYLNKDCTFEELQEAVYNEDLIYYSKEVLRSLSGITQQKPLNTNLIDVKLTEREMEILKFLCDGLSPKEISEKIFLSPRTVETHKNNIMQKFDVNSIGRLISVALKNNLV